MFRKTIRRFFRFMFIAIIFTTIGIYAANKLYFINNNSKITKALPSQEDTSLSFVTEESIINQLKQCEKLITLEVDLSEKIVVDNSWGNWDAFKKLQKINFIGKGKYSIDLSNVTSSDINIDRFNNIVTVSVPKPIIDSITIDEQNTVFENTEKGFLRFGEIRLTPDELNFINKEVKARMEKKLQNSDNYTEAEKHSQSAISNIVKLIAPETTKITVTLK